MPEDMHSGRGSSASLSHFPEEEEEEVSSLDGGKVVVTCHNSDLNSQGGGRTKTVTNNRERMASSSISIGSLKNMDRDNHQQKQKQQQNQKQQQKQQQQQEQQQQQMQKKQQQQQQQETMTQEELDLAEKERNEKQKRKAKLAKLVPKNYLQDPLHAEPSLDNLRSTVASLSFSQKRSSSQVQQQQQQASIESNSKNISNDKNNHNQIRMLLEAADKDVLSHTARIRAVMAQDPSILSTYSRETDTKFQERNTRHLALRQHIEQLRDQAPSILEDLNNLNDPDLGEQHKKQTDYQHKQKKQLSKNELLRERLRRWERALQLYVHNPGPDVNSTSTSININAASTPVTSAIATAKTTSITEASIPTAAPTTNPTLSSVSPFSTHPQLTLMNLLEKLCQGCTEDEELSQALLEASHMCNALIEQTSNRVKDSAESAAETEDAYHIRLEAHSVIAKTTLDAADAIHSQFLTHGREALRIGHALEAAEAQRRRCEDASALLRQFWTMENLAEQEERGNHPILVNEEVRGVIPSSSCRMDPLFTRPEHSLPAAHALRNLRNVIKSRGNTATAAVTGAITAIDERAPRRFDLTAGLIERTSSALEQRLLNTFSKVYAKGGTYDFSSVHASKRAGRLDWVTLREVAEALTSFDSGKNLHKRYVGLVITTKFPELFTEKSHRNLVINKSTNGEGKYPSDDDDYYDDDDDDDDAFDDDDDEDIDMDEMRSKLSSLFHRVSEVCTKEFQLIAHVFSKNLPTRLSSSSGSTAAGVVVGPEGNGIVGIGGQQQSGEHRQGREISIASVRASGSFPETYPLTVARALLQCVISDQKGGLRARINNLLESVDRRGGFDTGSKKLDTFVVIHEKAAGLFSQLKEAAEKMWGAQDEHVSPMSTIVSSTIHSDSKVEWSPNDIIESVSSANKRAILSLIQFLSSQEVSLSSSHRRGYLNLELRLLHHQCCSSLDCIGAKLLKPSRSKDGSIRPGIGTGLADYTAPIMLLDKEHIRKGGSTELLNGILKQSILRQPLIHATDSLARARLMFGLGSGGGGDIDSTARVIMAIFSQMCNFYGSSYLFPIVEALGKMLVTQAPSAPPTLPFDETAKPHELGVDGNFWIAIERVHSAAKAFDRELWAENRPGSVRVWQILLETQSQTSLTLAQDRRVQFFQELEERGETVILRALDTLSTHIQWILVTGGESRGTAASGGPRLLQNLTGQSGGPYAVPTGSLLDSPNSPAVKSLTFCLRAQFVNIQAALTPQSLTAFWTALSMRLYDVLVIRLLQYYYVSTVGAVILSRDVEALRSVAMLAGSEHSHWDNLRELLTLYMTPPDTLKTMLVGADSDVNSGKGLFGRVGKDQSLVFMSRRIDYRYKTNQGLKKSQWAIQLLDELGINIDPTDSHVNITLYAAQQKSA